MIKPYALALVAVSAAMCGSLAAQQSSLAAGNDTPAITPPKAGISMDLSAIDKSADPCTDFYAYACGNWRKDNPIPADKTRWGRFDELGEHNLYSVYTLVKEAADHPENPLQVKYGNYFAACMNDELAETLGTKPIQPALGEIDGWNDKAKLSTLVGSLQDSYGLSTLYGFGSEQDQKDSTQQIGAIGQGGLSLPDRDYYLEQSDRMKTIRGQYVEHLTKMFTLLGDTPEKAADEANAVMTVETALAQGSVSRVDLREPANVYHIKTLAELKTLTPDYSWGTYFSDMKQPIRSLNVATPTYFTAMNAEIEKAGVPELKSYLRWHVLHAAAPNLTKALDEENFRFFSGILGGQKEEAPRWKRCTQATDRALGEAVGKDWVAKNFTPAAKDNMEQLVHNLETALGQDIKNLDWMSAATKQQALLKLSAFRDKIGYPEVWRDYSTLTVSRTERIQNGEHAAVFAQRRDLNKIGKPVDEKEWGMTPPTVNAYYDPSMNDINFPAGILQPPFYDFHIDPAVNYGAIGVVIGHEMTHGFDDEGSQYDPHGNVRSWWTPADKAEFDKRTGCEVKEYGAFEPVPGVHLNGKLTLGENTADNGGLHVSYQALHTELAKDGAGAADKKVDGYTPDQRFFLAYAQVWCENTREQTAVMRAKTDPHSPGHFRTDGAVQNFDKFGEAFGCKKGAPMYPENSCQVW